MGRKTSPVPAVVAAPNPSAKDEWLLILCTITPGCQVLGHKVRKRGSFPLRLQWISLHVLSKPATGHTPVKVLFSFSCNQGLKLPPAKRQMLWTLVFGRLITKALLPQWLFWMLWLYTVFGFFLFSDLIPVDQGTIVDQINQTTKKGTVANCHLFYTKL